MQAGSATGPRARRAKAAGLLGRCVLVVAFVLAWCGTAPPMPGSGPLVAETLPIDSVQPSPFPLCRARSHAENPP